MSPSFLSFSMHRALWAVAGLSLLIRLVISATFPITGDEAFFYWWGVFPDWGYYDHPPMVGWFIAAMLHGLGDSTWSIRLPTVLLPLVQGLVLWWGVSAWDRERAPWAALLFWLTPINWINTLVTTDTPLMLWSMLSVACLIHAEVRPRLDGRAWVMYALSGVFIGCAFLSKYFSVVLG
jgi:4-amino-4-deoxy-L-arabinose transferase-like glycosyltransferase